jgi:hypothetical protein
MIFSVVAVLAVGVGGGALRAQEAPPAPPGQQKEDQAPRRQTAEEAIATDAQWYARSEGVSQAEAARRLRMQRDTGPIIERLRNAHKNRLAGIVIDHKPAYRIRVRLTGNLPVQAQNEAAGGDHLPVMFETGAPATLDALVASLRANQAAVAKLYPNLAGIGTDESTSEIVLFVNAPGADAANAARAKFAEVQKLLGQPARLEITDAYPTVGDVRGGSLVQAASGAYCTSGFVVKNTSTGVTGVITAGHCDNALTYYNPNMTTIPLTFVTGSEYLDADQDVQVHTSTYVEQPEFYYDDAKQYTRVLTGKRLKSSTAYGDNVCHRGERTGYSCGYVQQTNYAPYSPGDPLLCGPYDCAAVFVRVTGAALECYPGDSGGPWFASTVAFGIYMAQISSGTGAGQCTEAIYMTTDTISSGWALLYGQ